MSTTTVKERPILFSGTMVRAILEGRKTQTRRVMKPQPEVNPHSSQFAWRWHPPSARRDPRYDLWMPSSQWLDGLDPTKCGAAAIVEFGPYGVPGDWLWVRETWAPSPWTPRAIVHKEGFESGVAVPRWKPSIHMPRWASRITLEITDVRVQRLQEISEGDSIAEGSQCAGVPASLTNRGAFAKLWNSINEKRGFGWESNPWVWAITFKRVD